MKKSLLVVFLLFGLSFNVGKIWDYLTYPTNALVKLTDCAWGFAKDIYNNVTFNA